MKATGAAYLLCLAVQVWRGASVPLAVQPPEPARLVRSDVVRGLVVQLSNPKTAVVYASVCAALLPSSPSPWLPAALPASVYLIEAGWYSVVALGFSHPRLRALFVRVKTGIDRCAVVMLGGLGVRMMLTAGSKTL